MFPVVVNKNDTLPTPISPTVGVYVVIKLVGDAIDPLPEVIDQITPVAVVTEPVTVGQIHPSGEGVHDVGIIPEHQHRLALIRNWNTVELLGIRRD